MVETPHVIVGAAIAMKVGNPALALPLALASHFLLDKIPHWNPHFYTETQKLGHPSVNSTIFAVSESLFALGVGVALASRVLPNTSLFIVVILSCLVSVLPDQIKLPYFYLNKRQGLLKRWTEFERSQQVNASFVPGVFTQVIVALAGLWWIAH